MNREEAIRRLRYIRMDYLGYPPFLEPIDMAIEALSADTSSDLISRANAIRWVKTECNQYGKPTLDYDSGLKVIEHLKKMPSELPSAEAEWIPCDTSGMPPEGEEVLVSDGKYIWIDETVAGDATEDGYMMWWCNGSDWIGTAWMPLPKPYREDGEA